MAADLGGSPEEGTGGSGGRGGEGDEEDGDESDGGGIVGEKEKSSGGCGTSRSWGRRRWPGGSPGEHYEGGGAAGLEGEERKKE